MAEVDGTSDLIAMTADIAVAYASANKIPSGDLAKLISTIHKALSLAGAPAPDEAPAQEPAVPVRSSIKRDYVVYLEDGKQLKMLRRYLRIKYAMTPDEYRTKWGLPRDYPMVAPAYSETRRTLAHASGLGRASATEAVEKPAPKRKLRISAGNTGGTDAPAKQRGRPSKAVTRPKALPDDGASIESTDG